MYIICTGVYLFYSRGKQMISVKVTENPNNLFYDLNSICETADSIYWTLVPDEVFSVYESNPYYLFNNSSLCSLKDVVTWW